MQYTIYALNEDVQHVCPIRNGRFYCVKNNGKHQNSPQYNDRNLQGNIANLFVKLMRQVTKKHLQQLNCLGYQLKSKTKGQVSFMRCLCN